MSERAELLAGRIKDSRKTIRYEEKAFCPRDGRLVAAIVLFEGSRCLWLVGGRSGSHGEMLAEWKQNIADARADIADMNRRGVERASQQPVWDALAVFEESYESWAEEGWPAVGLGMAFRLEGPEAPSMLPRHTPCPGCTRTLEVARNAEGRLTAR